MNKTGVMGHGSQSLGWPKSERIGGASPMRASIAVWCGVQSRVTQPRPFLTERSA